MPNSSHPCSGEAAAHAAGAGDSSECFLCDKLVPSGEMIPCFEGRKLICAACDEELAEERRAAVREVLADIFRPPTPTRHL